jgi:hypothetical protein
VLLRGVNLGGSSKVPVQPPGATHLPPSLDAQLPISFVGRPFPLHAADAHFARLRRWGFNGVRLLTTWEAIAHAGPDKYDEDYLAYVAAVVARAAASGLYVMIDMHQDAWGRWSGGDGAPHWTYTAVGLDPAQFDAREAAFTMQRRLPHYPPMSWTGNSARFAARTMVTLLLAGETSPVIAATVGISAPRLRHVIAALYDTLGIAHSRGALISWAQQAPLHLRAEA